MKKTGTITIEVTGDGDGFLFWESYSALKKSVESNCAAFSKEMGLDAVVTATEPRNVRAAKDAGEPAPPQPASDEPELPPAQDRRVPRNA